MSGNLQDALATFAKVEANLDKLQGVWSRVRELMPDGPAFGFDTSEWRMLRAAWEEIRESLPPIDAFVVEPSSLPTPDELAQAHLDALEELSEVPFLLWRDAPGNALEDYRVRLARARRNLTVGQVRAVVDDVDAIVGSVAFDEEDGVNADGFNWTALRRQVDELEQLAGGLVARKGRWSDLRRHLRFAQAHDLRDIVSMDWPSVRADLEPMIFSELEPLPVDPTLDLGTLARSKPARPSAGPAPLRWDALDDEQFERLVFVLIQRTEGFDDVNWLMPTRAADRGRDIQAYQVTADPMMPTRRLRVIVQCKHWQSRSINPDDISSLLLRMPLWEPPKVEVVIIATSGRFTADAVAVIEKREEAREMPRVVMLSESDLETQLSQHQGLLAQFGLR